ncbi:MAG: DUF5716 family protein, partial [Lachnospiraceae bacterium]
MIHGSIIGYELNGKNCQISYYSEELQEPKTMEVASDNYQIPLVIGSAGDNWAYGRAAKRLASRKEGTVVSGLLDRAIHQERIRIGEKTYEAVWLLAKFIELSLQQFSRIDQITFTVPTMSVDIDKMLKGIGQRMNIARECVYVQDYQESFCHYMCYQPKELWQFEAALFYCDRDEMKAYMLRKLKT